MSDNPISISIDLNDIKPINIPNSGSYLELCIGPMFAGKTTYLLNLIAYFNSTNQSFTVIKPILDSRYNNDKITSHNNLSYSCIALNKLNEITEDILQSIIIIDEGQFFPDLVEIIKYWLTQNRRIFISGLNGEFNMNPLGDIINLIPIADNIIYKRSLCKCGYHASFSSLKNNIKHKSNVVIGSNDKYMPTCRNCFENNSNKVFKYKTSINI
jgi:thymidine kinase